MKLLRDFIRLRSAGRFSLTGRRNAPRRPWTITVPAPLNAQAESVVVDMHWNADPTGRPVAHWHEHVPPQSRGHLQLVSSH